MKETESIDSPIIDGHVDILYEMMRFKREPPFEKLSSGPVTLDTLKAGDVRVITAAFYCADAFNGAHSAAAHLKSLFEAAETYLAGLPHIETARDLEACYRDSSGPGAFWLLENADALIDMGLGELEKRAVRIVGLTHSGKNRIGDGNGVVHPRGLSSEGKQLVKALNREGFLIDVAHLSDPSFADLVRLVDGPLISSHTGFRFFCNKPRNLDMEQLRILFERQGMVGVSVNPEMLSATNRAGIEDVFKHIDWVAEHFGEDCVAIGSDYCGFDTPCQGLEDASMLSRLVAWFQRYGYSEEAIVKILGGNWYRLYGSLLG